jgi:glucokinase
MILAGDIGGTKTLVAFFARGQSARAAQHLETFPSRDFPGLEAVLKEYLARHPERIEFACFGVPGPVVEGRCETPNLPWVVETRALEAVTRGRVRLLNDLEALGYGLAALAPDEFLVLNPGRARPGANAALIAPGTGLGESILVWDGRMHVPQPSEGGHSDFAPRNEVEIDLLRFLRKRHPRVSYDRILSGKGLRALYDFLRASDRYQEGDWLGDELAQASDDAAVITRAALERRSALCVATLDLWVAIFGAEAGNLALKALATAGVYLGGGIAPKILPKLRDGDFMKSFQDKGRLSPLVAEIPVRVALNDHAALIGAARFALEKA